ncbi:MAG: YARHG domain-containing protein [Muricoprocola sp.]
MRRIRGRHLLILAETLLLIGGAVTGVQAEETVDMENLFYTYAQDNIIGRFTESDYLYLDGIEQKSYNGFIALDQIDLDWNGVEELLAIRLRPVEEDGVTRTKLIAEVYEYQTDRLQRVAQTNLVEDVLTQDQVCTEVFVVTTDQGLVLCCEDRQTATILADGTDWNFTAVTYGTEGFTDYGKTKICGSYWESEAETESRNLLGSLGLYPGELVYTPITKQTDAAQSVAMINRYSVTDYETIVEFLQGNMGERIQYGETEFVNLIQPELELKMTTVFSEQINRETATVSGTEQAEEYIIPDSNERYLTQEDLSNLTEYEVLLARNEIYARHGRIFRDEELSAYFNSKSWYEPTVTGEEFTYEYAASVFNDYEITNISFIVEYEKEHGLNQ